MGVEYSFLLEGESGIQSVKVREVDSIQHALLIVRKKYPFADWRIINVAETISPAERVSTSDH